MNPQVGKTPYLLSEIQKEVVVETVILLKSAFPLSELQCNIPEKKASL